MSEIDLRRHGVIEASAGTGKTHTLERLVLRLLIETEVKLDQILLVTYTEKATGELKSRLREALEKECTDNTEHRRRLQAALDAFDQANVFTIHGFCQRALEEYALENMHDLRMQLVDDKSILETCLRELQRKQWRAEYGARLREVLELADYDGENWERIVQDLALRYRPGCKHVLRPEALSNWPDVLWERERAARVSLGRWRELAGPCPTGNLEDHRWSVGFRKLDHNAGVRQSRHDNLFLPLLKLLTDTTAERQPLLAMQRFVADSQSVSSFDKHGFRLLTDSLQAKARAQIDQYCPNLRQVVDDLEILRQDKSAGELRHQLTIRTVLQLQEALADYKRERGLQSFEDMLTRLEAALDPERNPRAGALCRHLRNRFRYAIVDEFQDTDPIQWNIFKRIFVAGATEQRLFVVGDPKQAIFAFRGADLHSYMAASKELKEVFGGSSYPLDTNWRSCPDLIGALNDLFEKSQWFDKTGIAFNRVGWPLPPKQRNVIVTDRTARNALNAVDLTDHVTLVPARRLYARFIAGEISRLLGRVGDKPALEIRQKAEQPRPLCARDVCILVYKRTEANPILAALQDAQIPYSFYKQPGLWQSREAIHLDYLLRALTRPDDNQAFHKLLLTRFFRIRPEQLARSGDLPPDHATRRLFDSWVDLAEKRAWAALFQSVLDDTGVLLSDLKEADGDRRLANFRHMVQSLEASAYDQDLDLLGLLEVLRDRRRHGSAAEGDLQPVETEQPKVQIMTVHASKGLEFPIVFLAGGFTSKRMSGCLTYRDDNSSLVFDLCPDDAALDRADREQEYENRRLLYVALTRAIFKLYVPKVDAQKKYHSRGPIATILAPALDQAEVETITGAVEPRGTLALPLPPLVVSPPRKSARALSLKELFPQLPPDIATRRIDVQSFSSLHRRVPFQALEVPKFGDKTPHADDEEPASPRAEDSLRGAAFGSLIHDVLETIRFDEVGAASGPDSLLQEGTPSCRLIDKEVDWYLPELTARLRKDEIRAVCRRQVAQLVWTTLHTPLSEVGAPLWQIPQHDRLHELEFHFPQWEGAPPTEMTRSEGFFTGFMDLVFRKQGRYFLADWKTNVLAGYGPQEIAQSMRESEYHRQYCLYVHALSRWFRHVHGADFDFARDFGGVYYLYLRGLNGKDDTTGVFFHRPTNDDLRLER